jgi:hypothetical protein
LKGAVIATSAASGKCELCRMTMEIFTTASILSVLDDMLEELRLYQRSNNFSY